MNFQYTAKSSAGQMTRGFLEALSLAEARQQLRQQGLFPLTLKATGAAVEKASAKTEAKAPRFGLRRVSKSDVLMVTSQLTIMSQSGVDLAEALQNVAAQCTSPGLKVALDQVYRDVEDGCSISAALKRQAHIFGEAYVASVAAGEASGRVPEVLARMADLLRNEIRLMTTVKGVLAYPVVLVLVASLVVGALVFFVLPQFGKVFADLEAPAPASTQLLLDSATLVRANLLVMLPVFGLLALGLAKLWFSPGAKRHKDRFLLNGVLVRHATRALLTGRTFRLLGTMLQSGIPLLEAIRLCRSSVKNALFRELFDAIEGDVLNGRKIGPVLSGSPFVPLGASQMIATAEKTGKLGPVLQTVGEFYEDEGERRVRELAKLLEPAIIVIMGVIVAFVVMSVMLPLLEFSTLSSRQ